ncbi:hypothetical protein QL093DRAFT_2526719 [Fusarium oxysporum]|nr:hypothetical protein QL093DRAFT_2526719 [Fusarium oxysporum]
MCSLALPSLHSRPKDFCKYPYFKTLSRQCDSEHGGVYSYYTSLWLGYFDHEYYPELVCKIIFPPLKPVLEFSEDMVVQIADLSNGLNHEAKETTQPTVFHDILSSLLPPYELSLALPNNEAAGLVAASTYNAT